MTATTIGAALVSSIRASPGVIAPLPRSEEFLRTFGLPSHSAATTGRFGKSDPSGGRLGRTPTSQRRRIGTSLRWRSWRLALMLALAGMAALAACAPSHVADPGASVQSTSLSTRPSDTVGIEQPPPDLQKVIDEARQLYGAPGALVVVHRDGQRFEVTSGAADLSGTPVAADMPFRVGSITKTVVAALALSEVAQGRLDLDDIVGEPLQPEPPVTLRMLLSHTSGIFDIGNEGDAIADIARLDDRDLIDEVAALEHAAAAGERVVASDRLIVGLAETHDRYFRPGTGFHYSNTNYQLAAMTLEQVSGQPLAGLLDEKLTRPLGLHHTSLAPEDLRSPLFRGYATDLTTGDRIDATDDLLAFGNGGSGGLISTADELTTILNAIVHGTVVPGDLRAAMLQPTPESGDSYGLGIAVYNLECGVFYGHEGRVNGTASIALTEATGPGRSVVVAFNSTIGVPQLVALAEQLICPSTDPTP